MIQVRNSVFETNSSSSHSIVVLNKESKDRKYTQEEFQDGFYLEYRDNGIFKIPFEDRLEFGRYPFRVLSSFRDKLYYSIASLCGNVYPTNYTLENKEKFRELVEIAKKYVKGLSDIEAPKTECWVESHDKNSYNGKEVLCDYYGDIDHQSSGLLKNCLLGEDISLEEFLTNKKYVIIIDGDEYDTFLDLIDSGIVELDIIKSAYTASYGLEERISKKKSSE